LIVKKGALCDFDFLKILFNLKRMNINFKFGGQDYFTLKKN